MILKSGESFSIKGVIWIALLLLVVASPSIINLLWIPGPLQLARVVFSMLLVLVPLLIFRIRPRIYVSLLIPVFILAYADIVHLLNYSKHLTIGSVASFFYTDSKEAVEFLWHASNTTIPTSIGIIGSAAVLYLMAPKKIPKIKVPYIIALVALLVAIPTTFSMQLAFPNSAVQQIARFYKTNQQLEDEIERRSGLKYTVAETGDTQDMTLVLVLGESANKNHLGIYGYPGDTTPTLAQRSDLVLFNDATAPANLTANSVPMLLTPATTEKPELFFKYKSILGLADTAGYSTYWISNQAKMVQYSNEITAMAEEARFRVFKNTGLTSQPDELLLPVLDSALQDENNKKLIVMHALGSHVDYTQRYPEKFDVFKDKPPYLNTDDADVAFMINTYDNSIVYSDYILSQVIARMEKRAEQSCVIYLADHGEFLSYTSPKSGHGYPTAVTAEAEVPLVLWCSPDYYENHPKMLSALTKNKALPITTEDIFYAMADLLNIKFTLMRNERSFVNANYSPPERRLIMNGREKIDEVASLKSSPDFIQ